MTIDQKILLWLNGILSSSTADFVFIWVSERWFFSFPLLLIIIASSTRFISKIPFWNFVFGLIFTVITADQLGGLLKDWVAAPRPCDDFYEYAREGSRELMKSCNSLKGMPSNHAFNFAAAATFISLCTQKNMMRLGIWAICILVSISRIYLAKHYPSQVLVGIVLGLALGTIVHMALTKIGHFRSSANR